MEQQHTHTQPTQNIPFSNLDTDIQKVKNTFDHPVLVPHQYPVLIKIFAAFILFCFIFSSTYFYINCTSGWQMYNRAMKNITLKKSAKMYNDALNNALKLLDTYPSYTPLRVLVAQLCFLSSSDTDIYTSTFVLGFRVLNGILLSNDDVAALKSCLSETKQNFFLSGLNYDSQAKQYYINVQIQDLPKD
ncbi:hypothetical protein KBD08_01070 [Candidatus Babeliales bacterium]|nr:hypothetical protein [Candidatus Babeliales bacterium]